MCIRDRCKLDLLLDHILLAGINNIGGSIGRRGEAVRRLRIGQISDCLIYTSVGKKGVVREAATHREVIEAASGFAVQNGFSAIGLDFSPIKGPEGNIEFLMLSLIHILS